MATRAPDLAELTALIEANGSILGDYITQAQNMARQSAEGLDFYDHDQIKGWAEGLASRVEAYMANVARSTDAYIARLVRGTTGKVFNPAGPISTAGGVRTGITHAGIYGRLTDKFRYWQGQWDKGIIAALDGKGNLPVRPQDLFQRQLATTATSDVLLTARNQATRTLTQAQKDRLIVGYRRVLHPELAGEGDCGMCIVASTRIYHSANLMPLHPGCHCTQLPVTADHDPGAAINESDLNKYYGGAGSNKLEDLRKTRYRIDEHGEFGPVLTLADHPIRTEQQAKRDTNPEPRKSSTFEDNQRKLRMLKDKRNELEKAYTAGDPDDPRLNGPDYPWDVWHRDIRDRIDKLDSDIANMEGDPLGGNLNGFPKIIGEHSIADDAARVNPNWGGRGAPADTYQINCSHCVNTYELRRRGYRVEALPMPAGMYGRQLSEILNVWRRPNGDSASLNNKLATSVTNAVGIVKEWPNGARGIVTVRWKHGGGHVFSVEKDERGKIHWVEPQGGYELSNTEIKEYFRNADTRKMVLTRMDDLRPSNVVAQDFLSASSNDQNVNQGSIAHTG